VVGRQNADPHAGIRTNPACTRAFARVLSEILPSAPDITIQIAHLAGAGRYAHDDAVAVYADAITAGDPRMKNVYFDVATVVDETQSAARLELIARRIRQIGVERILFGSDTPGGNRTAPLQSWATFRRRMPLTDDELRSIADNVAPYLLPPALPLPLLMNPRTADR
jgi:predicted TIM-barrel fold metal-dependent hydrolase